MIVVPGRPGGTPTELRGPTFTGDVWADPVLPSTDGVLINTVTFTPGAHTFWHEHEGGQILEIVSGSGWVCAEGEQPQSVRAGDTVWTPPGQRHWHGATADTVMSHTAISLGRTEWHSEVSDADYPPATKGIR